MAPARSFEGADKRVLDAIGDVGVEAGGAGGGGKVLRRRRARRFEAGREHPRAKRLERLEETARVLAPQHAADEDDRPPVASGERGRRIRQRPTRVRIVCAVQPKVGAPRSRPLGERSAAQRLKASRPDRGRHARGGGGLVDPQVVENVECGDRQASVGELVAAIKRWRRQVHQSIAQLNDKAAALFISVEIAAHELERRIQLGGFGLDCGKRFFRLAGDDNRTAALDDARLLPGDLGKLRPEQLEVVVVDWRDDADGRCGEDIRGVEAAAQTHLDDDQVGGVLGEGVVGDRRGDLEEADRLSLVRRLHLVDQAQELGVLDEPSCDADALGEAHEMRRGERVDLQPGRLGDGAQIGAGRALAVGSGDMDHRPHRKLGVAERGQQPLDATGGQVDQRRVQRPKALDRRVGGADGVVVWLHGRLRRRFGGFAPASG